MDDSALLHGGILNGHELRQGASRDHKTADVLGEMPGKAQDLIDQGDVAAHGGAVRIRPRRGQALAELVPTVPPSHGLGQQIDEAGIQPQGLAHIAQGAARPIGDDRGGQGGAVTPVLAVDVLNDLLPALVLEVHVDVRGLLPFLGNEALEQHMLA